VREDYFECLHSQKEHGMVRKVIEEQQKQIENAGAGDSGGGH